MWQQMPSWLIFGIFVPVAMGYLVLACIFCAILALELRWPRKDTEVRWNAVIFAVFFIPTSVLIVFAMRSTGLFDLKPLLSLSGISAILVGLLVADFFSYWFHRAQHAIPALWRLHSVHHSVEKFGPLTGYQHIAEVPLGFLLYTFPVALIVGGRRALIVGILTGIFVAYLHSSTRLHFGPLARLFCDNRIHRIHHSTEKRHYDRNFGMFTLIWDRLFGTAHFPAPDEWPEIGLDSMREPRTLGEFIVAPFRSGNPVYVNKAASGEVL